MAFANHCSSLTPTAGSLIPHGLKDQTEVVLVEEVPVEADDVEFVIRVRLVQLLENLQLLQSSLVPARTQGGREIVQRHTTSPSWRDTHIISLFLMILMATSLLALRVSLARTTLLNTPCPV